jgi:hypothetical protein
MPAHAKLSPLAIPNPKKSGLSFPSPAEVSRLGYRLGLPLVLSVPTWRSLFSS